MCGGDHHDHRNLNGFKPFDFAMISSRNFSVNLRILAVDDDADTLAFMSGLLKLLKHQVLSFRNPIEALSSLALEGNKFDLVMADLYLPTDRDGLQLVTRARDEFNLPIIMVSADARESTILTALQHGVFHYIVKPVCFSDVKNLWQLVMRADAARRNALVRQIRSTKGDGKYSKRKRSSNVDTNDFSSAKKQKVTWTAQLHARFLEAVYRIGLDQAVPKRILEVMNVEGLTRENVASHLQKYRMFLRKVVAKISTSKSSVHRPRNARGAMLFQQIGSDRRFGSSDHEASSSLGYKSNSFEHADNFSGFQSVSATIDWAKNAGPSPMAMHQSNANLSNTYNASAGIGNPTYDNVGTLNWNSDFNSATRPHEEQYGGTLLNAPNSDISRVTALDCGSTSTDICSYPKFFDEDEFDFSDLFSDEFPLKTLDKDQDLDKFMESLLN